MIRIRESKTAPEQYMQIKPFSSPETYLTHDIQHLLDRCTEIDIRKDYSFVCEVSGVPLENQKYVTQNERNGNILTGWRGCVLLNIPAIYVETDTDEFWYFSVNSEEELSMQLIGVNPDA